MPARLRRRLVPWSPTSPIGKPKFADREQALQETLARLDAYRSELISLIEGDAEAFSKLAACWKMPKGTEEERACRSRAEQEALHAACEVPLSIMRVCARVVEADEYLVLDWAKNLPVRRGSFCGACESSA